MNFRTAFVMSLATLAVGCSNQAPSPAQTGSKEQTESSASDVDSLIAELEPILSSYPPLIDSDEQLAVVDAKYDNVKQLLDLEIESSPGDATLVYKRGRLQSMGHNLDKKDAWQGAEDDFLLALEIDPDNIKTLVELGLLYVNSEVTLAPKAEVYFSAAQELYGEEPHEGAQKGLLFCYYYQGRFSEAVTQAEFMVESFPGVKVYSDLLDISIKAAGQKGDQ